MGAEAPLAVRRGSRGKPSEGSPGRVFPPFLRVEKWGRSRSSLFAGIVRICASANAHRFRQNVLSKTQTLRWFAFLGYGGTTPSVIASGDATVSLRLGHAAALTCPRHVIHSRGVASLPQEGG